MRDIILSVRPEHLTNILAGKKTVELRKTFPLDFQEKGKGQRVFLYECGPKGRHCVIGVCALHGYIKSDPDINGYGILSKQACLSEIEIATYAKGKKVFGWAIASPRELPKPLQLSDFGLNRPPQSWCYSKE